MATTVQSPNLRTTGPAAVGPWARYINIIAGAWLFVSAFLWHRPDASRINAWIVGAAIVIAAAWAIRDASVRYVNTALSIWLFIAAVAVFRVPGPPMANDVVVSIIVFVVSLISNAVTSGRGGMNLPTPGAPVP